MTPVCQITYIYIHLQNALKRVVRRLNKSTGSRTTNHWGLAGKPAQYSSRRTIQASAAGGYTQPGIFIKALSGRLEPRCRYCVTSAWRSKHCSPADQAAWVFSPTTCEEAFSRGALPRGPHRAVPDRARVISVRKTKICWLRSSQDCARQRCPSWQFWRPLQRVNSTHSSTAQMISAIEISSESRPR